MSAGVSPEFTAARQLLADRDGPAIGLDEVIVGEGALDALVPLVQRLIQPGTVAVVLEDATVMYRDGTQLKPLVAKMLGTIGPVRRTVVGPPGGAVHADAATIENAIAATAGAGCVVVVGSGTLTDIGKVAAQTHSVPLVVVQTAASVNGYADDMAVVLRDGVKRTVPSVWPNALIIDTRVLAGAPTALTRSGYAEMMAMFTAPADWRLATVFGHDDSFDDGIVGLYRPRGGRLLESAADLRAGRHDALDLLAGLLTASGLAMGVAGRTAPLSGMEHLVSHLIDMSAAADGRPVGLHGAQVGIGSIVAACAWQRLLSKLDPGDLTREAPPDGQVRPAVERAFAALDANGRTAAECRLDCERKFARWNENHDLRARLARNWPDVREELATLVGDPRQMVHALRTVGAPVRFADLNPPIGAQRVRWALASCHLMRDRFTVVDLAFLSGHWTDDDIDAVLMDVDALGAG